MVTAAIGVATGVVGERYDMAIRLLLFPHHREPTFQVSRASPTSSLPAFVVPLRLA
jgi:hypothetical protein